MKILGYGEDALSYWALRHQLGAILKELGDDSAPRESVVYFRPSFGRRGNPPVADGSVASSSQFGEFDAIVGSARGIYLIETKWKPSSYANGGIISLRPEQVFRHKVFRAYLAAWRTQPHGTWSEFSAALGGLLAVEQVRMPVAPTGSQLARNLEQILGELALQGAAVHDVLLYLQTESGQSVASVQEAPTFTLVKIPCPSAHGFIEMS